MTFCHTPAKSWVGCIIGFDNPNLKPINHVPTHVTHLLAGVWYISAQICITFIDTIKYHNFSGTMCNWLKFCNFTVRETKKGIYFDGHEREDVVKVLWIFLIKSGGGGILTKMIARRTTGVKTFLKHIISYILAIF